jgi:hypothetical protein
MKTIIFMGMLPKEPRKVLVRRQVLPKVIPPPKASILPSSLEVETLAGRL